MDKDNALGSLWMLYSVPTWSKVLCRVLERYNTPRQALDACKTVGLDKELFTEEERAAFNKTDLQSARDMLDYCRKRDIDIISYGDGDFPTYLREIPTPPVCLFVKGKLPDTAASPSITIVGTRECSERGKRLTAKMAYDLSAQGFCVVSGLARGIDTYAHKGCLMANASPTVAVLAGSVEDPYPRENTELYNLICRNGAVISETMPHGVIGKWAFHQRNRILSGLTLGTVVVESGTKGGSLITASHALDQNRTVFAIPGEPGSSHCEGTNMLIRQGAVLCSSINDILSEYELLHRGKTHPIDLKERHRRAVKVKTAKKQEETAKISALSPDEAAVYNALADGNYPADALCDRTALPFPLLITVLQSLELSDLIEQLPGGIYRQKHL